ncbi:M20/M25/M40 family metallo-hydrolase [Sporosarcina sp. PTS2304]|uniref:M20/M25/M40 family metallo-hydrolase n=1 Tax=Sporosarcina sp. PTS2304 TaxID=2283194 RepID=UPI000E0D4EAD|nr:M20/M25/M40 family metallo-hydrolase [Sporosarcina sp. PTS2304]AXI01215.1 M20/M25/M40 family metallo-hydrolase [Sporosarcina sp. PTS2304]
METLTNWGPRVTGTQAEQQTLDYIKETLQDYGYEVARQEFDLPAVKASEFTVGGSSIASAVARNSVTTEEAGVTAELFFAEFGEKTDFTAEASGKIALIARGGGVTFQDKVNHAQEAGAVGVIIYDNAEKEEPLSYSATSEIPAIGITKAQGESLKESLGEAKIIINVVEQRTSSNIIAKKYPENSNMDNEIVYITAHVDSVPGAPGANDNATGTAAALEMARVLKDQPLDKELRIVFVGAEEIGLVGSRYYANSLSEEERTRSIANFNMDMVATAWENATAIYTNTVSGEANLVTESANKVAKIIGTPSELVLFKRGSSDHVAFDEVGIPAANFIRREPGTHNLEPYYHNENDVMQYVSKERLKEMIDLVGGAVYSVVREK